MLITEAAVYLEITNQLVVNRAHCSLSVKADIDAQLDEVWFTPWDVCEVGNPILNMSGPISLYMDLMFVF